MINPSHSGSTLFCIRMIVRARYKQKSVSPSPISPNLLCVIVILATCPSSISVATPTRKAVNASQEGVPAPPIILARRYEAAKPRNHVSVLAMPTAGNNLPDCACLFRPRCQNRSLCCHATQNRNAGSRRNVVPGPSNKKLARSMARASMPMSKVTIAQERFNDGFPCAVLHDISHERPRKRHQPTGLNLSWRSVVSRSTTNRFSFSITWLIRNIFSPEVRNVSRETFLINGSRQGVPRLVAVGRNWRYLHTFSCLTPV